jgi:hypothetical protein
MPSLPAATPSGRVAAFPSGCANARHAEVVPDIQAQSLAAEEATGLVQAHQVTKESGTPGVWLGERADLCHYR